MRHPTTTTPPPLNRWGRVRRFTPPPPPWGLPRSFLGGSPLPVASQRGIRTEPAPPLRRGSSTPSRGGAPGGNRGLRYGRCCSPRWGAARLCPPNTHSPRSPGDLASTSTGPRSAGAAARPVAAGPGGHRGGSRVSSLSPPPPGPGLALLAPLPGPQAPVKTVAKTSLLPPHRRRGPALLKSP